MLEGSLLLDPMLRMLFSCIQAKFPNGSQISGIFVGLLRVKD